MKRSLHILAALVAISLCRQTSAAIFNPNDVPSLITAITTSNSNGADDTIELTTNGIYTLTADLGSGNGLPLIGLDSFHKLVIHGNGATLRRDVGAPDFRLFSIASSDCTISDLTITNGKAYRGGGILNHGTLTITNSTINFNSADGETHAGGGGIFTDNGTLTITNSTISGNSASDAGGGISNDHATLTITNSTIFNNRTLFSFGGGIYNDGRNFGSATMTVTNSTIVGNFALRGAGIDNDGEFAGSATLTVTNSTISDNSNSNGGGIYNAGTLNLNTSIVANHSGNVGPDILGTVSSGDYNLIENPSGATLSGTHNITGQDPMLGPFQDNGGPTFTYELLTGSPAIDAGDPNFTPPPDFDQRGTGFPRVVNNRIDIGAFEVQTAPAAPACPHPKGYWKNNPNLWPASAIPMTLGTQTTYTKPELLTILRTAVGTGPKADASLILADQLIAAKLNIANGADDPAPVPSTIADADTVLSLYSGKLPYRVRPNTTNGQRMVSDGNTLDSYNSGLLTPVCTP